MNKALFKYYAKQAVFIFILLVLYNLISINADDYIYDGDRFVRWLPAWCIFALYCMTKMRTEEHFSFVTSLPVTHKQEWITVWLVNVCGIVLTGIAALIIYTLNNGQYGFDLGYYIFPIIAEIMVVVFWVSGLMWLCTIKLLTVTRLMLYGILLGVMSAVFDNMGNVAGYLLNYKGNNFSSVLNNIYNFYISPLREFRNDVAQAIPVSKAQYIPDVSDASYVLVYVLMTVLLLTLISILVYWGRRNHAKVDLSLDSHAQMIYPKKIYVYLISGLVIIPLMLTIIVSGLKSEGVYTSQGEINSVNGVEITEPGGEERTGTLYEYDGLLFSYSYWDLNYEYKYLLIFIGTTLFGTLVTVLCGNILCGGIYYKGDGYSDKQIKSDN